MMRTYGHGDDTIVTNKKNGFRFPNDPDAVIPQAPAPVYIDKRSCAVKTEYLLKEKGMKAKNKKKQALSDAISKGFKEVEDKIEGRLREDDIIEMDKIDQLGGVGDLEDLDMMDIEGGFMKKSGSRNLRKNKRASKKSKSHYIINFKNKV